MYSNCSLLRFLPCEYILFFVGNKFKSRKISFQNEQNQDDNLFIFDILEESELRLLFCFTYYLVYLKIDSWFIFLSSIADSMLKYVLEMVGIYQNKSFCREVLFYFV